MQDIHIAEPPRKRRRHDSPDTVRAETGDHGADVAANDYDADADASSATLTVTHAIAPPVQLTMSPGPLRSVSHLPAHLRPGGDVMGSPHVMTLTPRLVPPTPTKIASECAAVTSAPYSSTVLNAATPLVTGMASVPGAPGNASNIIRLNVGGTLFTTRRSTLCHVAGGYLEALVSGRFRWELDHDGNLFIDRSADHFALILNWLRDQGAPQCALLTPQFVHELDYFGIKTEYFESLPKRPLIYAFGGKNADGEILNTVEVFDPALGVWQQHAPSPCPIVFAACTAIGPLVYITGGFTPKQLVHDLWEFDTALQAWRTRAPLLMRRYSHKTVHLNGLLYAGCGMQSTPNELVRLTHFECYNPQRDSWGTAPPLRERRFECAMEAYRGKIYVAGGRDQETSLNSVEVFDPETQAWTNAAPMPDATTNVSLVVVADAMYMVCTTEHTLMHRFNNDSQTFVAIGGAAPVDIPCPSCFDVDGCIYVFDTYNEDDFLHGTYLRFFPPTERWTVHHASLHLPRNAHTYVSVQAPWPGAASGVPGVSAGTPR